MSLIAELKAKQGDRSQQDFAASELGCSQAQLSRIYSGDKAIGVSVLKKIIRRYPELEREVIAFLLSDDMPIEHTSCTLMPV